MDVYFNSDDAAEVAKSWVSKANNDFDVDNLIRQSLYMAQPVSKSASFSGHGPSQSQSQQRAGLGFDHELQSQPAYNDLELRLLNKRKRQRINRSTSKDEANLDELQYFSSNIVDDPSLSRVDMIGRPNSRRDRKESKAMNKDQSISTIEKEAVRDIDRQSKTCKASASESEPVKVFDRPYIASEFPVKRKKTKTRSKQKNIRRDTRGNDLKPVHLQTGSKEYTGRPLTEVSEP